MNDADRQKPKPGALYVDHVSHFVEDLDAAAGVWEKLGLKVTPVSVQKVDGKPAGSSNRCVMLAEGYIEVLSPTHATPAAKRMRALMKRYAGVHLVCFGTPDAAEEHQRLAAHGFEPQPLVSLARAVDGGTARFKVVRLAPKKMPEGRIQYVEHLTPELVWRDVNALRLQEVFVVAPKPADAAARWAEFAGLIPRPEKNGVRMQTLVDRQKGIENLRMTAQYGHYLDVGGSGTSAGYMEIRGAACARRDWSDDQVLVAVHVASSGRPLHGVIALGKGLILHEATEIGPSGFVRANVICRRIDRHTREAPVRAGH